MKKNIFVLMSVLSLGSFLVADESCNTCAQSMNLWQPRSFNSYSTRDILHKKTFYENESHRDEWNGMFSVIPEFMQSLGQKCGECAGLGSRITWSGTNSMTYGSNDGKSDIDAYQFGMGNLSSQGTIELLPRVQHFGVDMMLHFTKAKDDRGLFFTLKAPLGAMMIETKVKEELTATRNRTTTYSNGTTVNLDTDQIWSLYPAENARYESLQEAWQSGTATPDGETKSSRHKLLAITNGRLSECKQTMIRMADLSVVLGYKLYASDRGFVDLGFKVTAPTGNVPMGEFVLEPIFGRAGHWGVGGELAVRRELYQDDNSHLDFWVQGELLHLFNGRTGLRSFDLKKNGKGSKYMLIQHYFPAATTTTNPTGRLASFVTHAVNITTVPVKSTFAVEGSVALGLDYHRGNWNALLGAEFWGRSVEKLELDCCQFVKHRVANFNDYAVLGRQISDDIRNGGAFDLSLCEPEATISKSQNVVVGVGGPPPTIAPTKPEGIKDARLSENRIPAKSTEALDVAGACEPHALTGKVTGQFGYTFSEHRYTPSIGLFGGVEFTARNNATVNMWSVGAQGSLNF